MVWQAVQASFCQLTPLHPWLARSLERERLRQWFARLIAVGSTVSSESGSAAFNTSNKVTHTWQNHTDLCRSNASKAFRA
jgi:hypothetical protein